MAARTIRLPNGHVTSPQRIARIRVHAARSSNPERPYLEIFEKDGPVYEGLVSLPLI